MARIRTIKPEFWKHEDLSALPEPTHMLAAALLNYADDEGYFNANPGLVKAECSPLREPSVSIHDSLTRLAKIGYLQFGTGSDSKQYGRVVTFLEHQVINRPSPSKIKALVQVWERSLNPHGVITEPSVPERNREQGTGKGKEQGKEPSVPQERDVGPVERVFAHWQTEFRHPKAILDAKRRKVIAAALASYDEATLTAALSGYRNSPHHMGQNERHTVYDDIEIFLRDSKHIEAGLNHARGPPKVLSAVERAREKLRSGNGDGRMVGEQFGSTGTGSMGSAAGLLRRLPDP